MRLNTTVGNYEHLENALKDQSVYIAGSGPSLIGYDYGRLKGKTVLAINHAFRELVAHGVEPAYHVFLDQRFLNESKLDVDNLPFNSISSANSTMSPRVKEKGGLSVINASNSFSLDSRLGFFSPRNSIAFAISCALYMGAKEIFLLGADCTVANKTQAVYIARQNDNEAKAQEILSSGRAYYLHCTSGKYNHTKDDFEHTRIFEVMVALFWEFQGKTDVPIYNCSRLSKIQNFPKVNLP